TATGLCAKHWSELPIALGAVAVAVGRSCGASATAASNRPLFPDRLYLQILARKRAIFGGENDDIRICKGFDPRSRLGRPGRRAHGRWLCQSVQRKALRGQDG